MASLIDLRQHSRAWHVLSLSEHWVYLLSKLPCPKPVHYPHPSGWPCPSIWLTLPQATPTCGGLLPVRGPFFTASCACCVHNPVHPSLPSPLFLPPSPTSLPLHPAWPTPPSLLFLLMGVARHACPLTGLRTKASFIPVSGMHWDYGQLGTQYLGNKWKSGLNWAHREEIAKALRHSNMRECTGPPRLHLPEHSQEWSPDLNLKSSWF